MVVANAYILAENSNYAELQGDTWVPSPESNFKLLIPDHVAESFRNRWKKISPTCLSNIDDKDCDGEDEKWRQYNHHYQGACHR